VRANRAKTSNVITQKNTNEDGVTVPINRGNTGKKYFTVNENYINSRIGFELS